MLLTTLDVLKSYLTTILSNKQKIVFASLLGAILGTGLLALNPDYTCRYPLIEHIKPLFRIDPLPLKG